MADYLKESSSDDSSEEEKRDSSDEDQQVLIPAKDPAEQVFDDNIENVNNFLQRIAKFEMSTNSGMTDMWRIKDMAF